MRFALGIVVLAAALLGATPGDARGASPILHERIPADPAEDAPRGAAPAGAPPAALTTPGGLVSAPDPHRLPSAPAPNAGDPGITDAAPNAHFHPDRDTHRPEVVPYDDPFTPSTA